MPNILEDLKDRGRLEPFSELYEVVHTVTFIKDHKTYRIEVCKDYLNPKTPYVVHYWVEDWVVLQPGAQTLGEYDEQPITGTVLRHIVNLPWVTANSADDALAQALGFLGNPM